MSLHTHTHTQNYQDCQFNSLPRYSKQYNSNIKNTGFVFNLCLFLPIIFILLLEHEPNNQRWPPPVIKLPLFCRSLQPFGHNPSTNSSPTQPSYNASTIEVFVAKSPVLTECL
ncbi:hypothetical protein OIU77_027273 [Salix suchowensis]|uniref:Transmembrane protein n=1 Tax=Salix suchowensis TaxID=1278906 RepID=A0ABQ9BP22_9ROSI|nr:hypothetical protein OIU77_027273 [Salix suchowensis]